MVTTDPGGFRCFLLLSPSFNILRRINNCLLGPYGTIIHPSVFCVLDRYPRRLELHNFKTLKLNLSKFQDTCLLDDGNSLAPWLQGMQLQASGVKAFRILVCGKTGVGKSTLINKVFGVEMTAESRSYEQGAHDINAAFESPRHPGLLMHDSRGWQAGSDTELDLIAKFLRHRAFQEDPAEALHVIWYATSLEHPLFISNTFTPRQFVNIFLQVLYRFRCEPHRRSGQEDFCNSCTVLPSSPCIHSWDKKG